MKSLPLIVPKSRVYALASVTITLHLDGGASHERTVNPRVPTNDKQLWLKLLHLDLQSHPPQSSILKVHLHAEPGATSKVQLGSSRLNYRNPAGDVTLARIAAIVGDGNVGHAILDDTRRFEDFHIEPFTVVATELTSTPTAQRLCLRVLRPAERTTVSIRTGCPSELYFRFRRYEVEKAYGPWLSGGDWWNEAIWGNEQWDVVARTTSNDFLACRLARDFVQDDWRVQVCMTDRYIELHASSAFSFLEGGSQPEALAERAYALNMPAMALMDRNGFYGSARFHKIATENKITAHVGAEDFFGLKDDSVGSVHGDGLAAEEWKRKSNTVHVSQGGC